MPPGTGRASKTVTAQPWRARSWAQVSPAGPEPTTATRFPANGLGSSPVTGVSSFAAVAGAFTVNMLIKPIDAVLVEFTNDAIRLVDPNKTIGLTSNLWFSIASVIFLTFLIAFITERLVEPRLGEYQGEKPADRQGDGEADPDRGERHRGAQPEGQHRRGGRSQTLAARGQQRAELTAIGTIGAPAVIASRAAPALYVP